VIDELDRTLTALNSARLKMTQIEDRLPAMLTSERLTAERQLLHLRAEIERLAARFRRAANRA
jgi:hypothetical protein